MNKITPVHELFGYSHVDLKDSIPNKDFHLLPCEIVEIFDALKKISKTERHHEVLTELQPEKFFKNVILKKKDVKSYERFLMTKLSEWYRNEEFSRNEFDQLFELLNGDCDKAFDQIDGEYGSQYTTNDWSVKHIYDLFSTLFKKQMLPAIVFLKTPQMCNELAAKLTRQLEKLESQSRDRDTLKKVEKNSNKHRKEMKRYRDSYNKNRNEDDRNQGDDDLSSMFKMPNRVDEKFTFLDMKYKCTDAEIDEEIKLHRHRKNIPEVSSWLGFILNRTGKVVESA
jgi:hypothetical protein